MAGKAFSMSKFRIQLLPGPGQPSIALTIPKKCFNDLLFISLFYDP